MKDDLNDYLERIDVQRVEEKGEVRLSIGIGPVTVAVELPEWAAPMVAQKIRESTQDAADEYARLAGRIEGAAGYD